jgi:Na+-transporting NADH:ubiquinone oxidoreductase subunit NqrD
MEELFVDVLAAGLAYVLELLVVGLICQVLGSSNC